MNRPRLRLGADAMTRSCAPMTGRETCASCATPSNTRWCWPTTGSSTAQHLPDSVRGAGRRPRPVAAAAARRAGMRGQVAETERRAIEEAMQAEDGNQTRAARRLGISRRALLYKLDKHGLKG